MVRGLAKAVRGASKAAKKSKQEYEESSVASQEGSFGARSFPHDVKEACWAKAETVKGRDPARWRRDALGNVVFRKLVGCQGCLCHDYDHIVPYSKGTVYSNRSELDSLFLLAQEGSRTGAIHRMVLTRDAGGAQKQFSKSRLHKIH
ncbi:uncharacterized protein [Physcomitrium patens]|uniref:HNH domain-containing protein n=1 Tax=Physcomitrium patens TaxID=3218 RepID=A0A7I4AQ99_PHYPA